MSSILEALRELEGAKPPSSRSRVAWAGGGEERAPLSRAAEAAGIVAFGLGLGAAGFGLVLWLGAPGAPEPVAAVVPVTSAGTTVAEAPQATSSPALVPAAPAPPIPAWLARMGPPRGRVDGDAGTRSDEPTSAGAPGLALVGVRYAEGRGQRTATLRIDGSPVVLREGETAHGIEVQLVTPDGAYVRRGAEVLMLERPR